MIEPCPFCGGVEIEAGMDNYERAFMRCSECGASGPFGAGLFDAPLRSDTFTHALQKWNDRVCLPKCVRLREFCERAERIIEHIGFTSIDDQISPAAKWMCDWLRDKKGQP